MSVTHLLVSRSSALPQIHGGGMPQCGLSLMAGDLGAVAIKRVDCLDCLAVWIGRMAHETKLTRLVQPAHHLVQATQQLLFVSTGYPAIIQVRLPAWVEDETTVDACPLPLPHVHEYAEVTPKGQPVDGGTVSFSAASQWRCRHCPDRLYTTPGSSVPNPRWSSDPDGRSA